MLCFFILIKLNRLGGLMNSGIEGIGNKGLDSAKPNSNDNFELWNDINEQMNEWFDDSLEEDYSITDKPSEIVQKNEKKLKDAYADDQAYLSKIGFEDV